MKKVFFLCLFLSVISCQNDEPSLPPANIDAELARFVNLFYTEAESRSLSLERNIDALLTSDISACGQGHSPEFNGMFDKPTILINEACWSSLDAIAKERLVFHELGHALLNRIHIEGILQNGYRKSLMCAGADFSCSDLPSYASCPEYRTYYVDELFDENTAPPQWASRNWDEVSVMVSDLNSSSINDWQVFSNCSASSFQVIIDSTSQNRPSNYSLKIASDCGDFITVRRRMKIENTASAEAIRLRCNLYQDLSGDGFRTSLFVKNTNNVFTSFNRSAPEAIIQQAKVIDNFTLQVECLEANADSLILDFQYLANTVGEVLIGDLDILLME